MYLTVIVFWLIPLLFSGTEMRLQASPKRQLDGALFIRDGVVRSRRGKGQ